MHMCIALSPTKTPDVDTLSHLRLSLPPPSPQFPLANSSGTICGVGSYLLWGELVGLWADD